MSNCSILNCTAQHLAKGYCTKHYYRLKRRGSATAPSQQDARPSIKEDGVTKIPLGVNARKGYAVVDIEFSHLDEHNWSLDKYGYPCAYINGKVRKLHHMTLGKPPKGLVTDHLNRDKQDNRLSNLRHVSYKENSANIPKELFNLRKISI